jgi:hydrogenase expression/formation protein HypD
MKYVHEYRDERLAGILVEKLKKTVTRPWVLMEICGGQTHAIMRYGLDQLIPEEIQLVHGPGCPVCVTPLGTIDKAIALASRPEVTLVTYGDMLRVPGSRSDLFHVRAAGGDVRVAYSPMEAVKLASDHPERQVVFFAIGFETTAPANAMAVRQAHQRKLRNFSALVCHVRVPPAIRLLLGSPRNRVQGFIAPGHVCTVMGYREYEELCREFRVPFVVGGFEPIDLLEAIAMLTSLLEAGKVEVQNQYVRSVTREGNAAAQRLMEEVFEVCDRKWRGIGPISGSGLRLRPELAQHDAERLFGLEEIDAPESPLCISAEVLQGLKEPPECPAFGDACTPRDPLGAPMVSGEGACAAYYRYRRPASPVRRD